MVVQIAATWQPGPTPGARMFPMVPFREIAAHALNLAGTMLVFVVVQIAATWQPWSILGASVSPRVQFRKIVVML